LIALNAAFGWAWITLGFVSGMLMGLRFYREDWLGGYDSWRRRLVRLGHIATVALGMLNVLFALTARYVSLAAWELQTVSIAFVIGGITMPIVCALAAWKQDLRRLFVIPVASLLTAGITLTVGIFKHGVTPA
jgi:ABC-type proline/glycine betaine transport system permease subunit